MSEEIVKAFAGVEIPAVKYADEEMLDKVITSTPFLPRVQLFSSGNDLVKEGKFPIGSYGLVRTKDQVENLSNQFDCLPILWRFKALRMPIGENPISYFNPKSPEFKKVQVDSGIQNSRCTFGIEFLIWIPTTKCFATMFFGSKTARRESPNMKNLWKANKAATCKIQLIKNTSYSWHGPVIVPCSTPFELPDSVELQEQMNIFANPKESEIEEAIPGETTDRTF
jgi:hypothetical protein